MPNFPRPKEIITLAPPAFWGEVNKHALESFEYFYAVKKELAQGVSISKQDAQDALAALFIHSHARIQAKFPEVAGNYPTQQYTNPRRRDLQDKPLFWIDHFTGGVRLASTLNWFSSMRLSDGSRPGASTHFVIGYHDVPYYIIPIEFCAWHARSRNRDSIGVEMVNAGPVHTKNGVWHFHSGFLPRLVLAELTPRRINPPYKGSANYLPYTADQVTNNIILKRLVVAATGIQLVRDRFTGHSDWQIGKKDPGPLWPMENINDAVFELFPLSTYRFLEHLNDSPGREQIEDLEPANEADYPSTTREDRSDENDGVLSITEVQKMLSDLGYAITIDGIYGPQTKKTIRMFQRRWNNSQDQDPIKIDGIPGPITSERLTQMHQKEGVF